MNRPVVVIFLLLAAFSSGSVAAQDKGFGLGVILGEPTGISFKNWVGSRTAIDRGVAWSFFGRAWMIMTEGGKPMNAKLFNSLIMIGILALTGCGLVTVIPEPPPPYPEARQPFLIPEGQLPPPGEYRIWYPDLPPGQQPPPGNCAELASQGPLGAWLITRPVNDRDKLKVFVYDRNRPNVVVMVRLYHALTGKFISEEKRYY